MPNRLTNHHVRRASRLLLRLLMALGLIALAFFGGMTAEVGMMWVTQP